VELESGAIVVCSVNSVMLLPVRGLNAAAAAFIINTDLSAVSVIWFLVLIGYDNRRSWLWE